MDYPVKQMNDETWFDEWPEEDPVTNFRNGPGDGGAKAVFEAQAADMVNSPSHYNSGPVECIDAIRQILSHEGFVAFCQGTAFAYTWRAQFKDNRDQDLAKAAWYLRMATGDDPRKGS